MATFKLLHHNINENKSSPRYVVAVGVNSQKAQDCWPNQEILAHDCLAPAEWNELIDRLINELQGIRRKGEAKFAEQNRKK